MSEWAQEKLEDVWVPVGERLRLPPSLISTEECHAMLQRVKQLEHSIVSTVKHTSQFVSFIAYISQLLELIKARRDQHQFKHRRNEIEGVIVTRALAILSSANFRFPHDLQLWATAIQFAIKNRRLIHVSKQLVQMLKYHSHDEHMWVYAAKIEFETLDSTINARALFLQGLRKHPASLLLNKEYFKFELLAAELSRERSMTVEELLNEKDRKNDQHVATTAKVAAVVFESIKQSRPFDYELISNCWRISRGFAFARELQAEIEKYMKEKFEHKEDFWVARVEAALQSETLDEVKDICQEALLNCFESDRIYPALIAPIVCKISTLTSKTLAMAYFKFCLDLFTQGLDLGKISDDMLKAFLEVLRQQDPALCSQLVQRALTQKPDNVQLNVMQFECLISSSDSGANGASEVWKLIIANEKLLNSLELWEALQHQFVQQLNAQYFYDSVMTSLLTCSKVTCSRCKIEMKRLSVKIVCLDKLDLSSTEKWKALQKILALPPVNYDLFQSIVKLCDWIDKTQMKWLFEHFTRLIGNDCVEIWIDYKCFLFDSSDVKQANLCNDRALRNLSKDLVPKFLECVSVQN